MSSPRSPSPDTLRQCRRDFAHREPMVSVEPGGHRLQSLLSTLLPIAVALLVSLLAVRVAGRLGVPRVTIYLIVGFVLGPHALAGFVATDSPGSALLLHAQSIEVLDIVSELAIGFVLFGIGGQFEFRTLRQVGPRIWALSGTEIGLTAGLVALAVGVFTGDWRLAVVAPALAVATAPSATLVTLREVESEGPATRALLLCDACAALPAGACCASCWNGRWRRRWWPRWRQCWRGRLRRRGRHAGSARGAGGQHGGSLAAFARPGESA